MSRYMQFDEEPELSAYRASTRFQDPRFAYNDQFEGTRADKLTPLDHSSLRSLRLLGLSYLALGLLILGFLLTFGAYLDMQLGLTSLYVLIAAVLIFIGSWLLLGKRRRTAPRDQLDVSDGRRLLFAVKTVSRPILEVQKYPVA